ncbi:MAG: PmoA family protein [Puniceicoccales bacterium]|nr:PmoA family protein [Puniceicoccales bacterium]
MQRRDFLKNSALLTGLGLLTPAISSQRAIGAPASGGKFPSKFVDYGGGAPQAHLTYYNYESQAWFRKNNAVLTAYRANVAQKYPYWYPLVGPKTGLSLIAETGQPWPHHRGVFFGCDRVNGGNYWQNTLKDGQILSQGFKLESIGEKQAVFSDRCLWAKPKQNPIIEDKRRYELTLLDENRYVLDAWFEVLPLVDITIEQTNHGLFGVRSAPDISVVQGGTLENSEGVKIVRGEDPKDNGEKAVLTKIHGKSARWCSFYGKRAGLDITEGIAVLVPEGLPEPFDKNLWFARHYGNISPMPMLFIPKNKPIKLPKGEVLKLRYRVVAFAGTPQEAGIDGLWKAFSEKQA